MKSILVFILLTISLLKLDAQRHELGVLVGVPNLIADIGKTNYIQPIPINKESDISYAAAFIYRFNFNPRMGLRLNIGLNHVEFRDKLAREDYRIIRDRFGDNDIYEGSVLFEYAFFDINDEQQFAHSPYIFAGFGAFMFKDRNYKFVHYLNEDANGNPIPPSNQYDFNTDVYYDEELKSALTIPFGIGYKMKFSYNWILGAEVGVRFTTEDRLDHSVSSPENFKGTEIRAESSILLNAPYSEEVLSRESRFKSSTITGNLTSTDWYVVSALTLTYTFGRPPCYCK